MVSGGSLRAEWMGERDKGSERGACRDKLMKDEEDVDRTMAGCRLASTTSRHLVDHHPRSIRRRRRGGRWFIHTDPCVLLHNMWMWVGGGGGGSQCSQFNVTSYFASTSSVLLVTGILSRAGDPLYCPRRAPRSSAGRGEMDVGKDRLSLLELAIAWRWG